MEKNVIVVASVLGIQSPSGLQLIHGNRTVTDLKHVAKINGLECMYLVVTY